MSIAGKTRAGAAIALTRYDGKQLELHAATPYAPGQPIVMELEANGGGVTLELKSIGSVKRDDGSYTVRARPTTMSKQAKDTLARLFGV